MESQLIEAIEAVAQPDWADVVQAIGAIGSLLVALLGFAVVIYQVSQLRQSLFGETHSKLYAEDLDLLKVFIKYPAYRAYFRDGLPIAEEDPDYGCICTLAEAIISHFEHVVLQEENLPDHIRPRWIQHIRGVYSTSPIIRQQMTRDRDWYSERLHEIVAGVTPVERDLVGRAPHDKL